MVLIKLDSAVNLSRADGFQPGANASAGASIIPHDAVLIDDVQRPVIPDTRVPDPHAAVVQRQPAVVVRAAANAAFPIPSHIAS